ncbi:hypothetical protein [uncultured Prochlorococcus sp.]|uniref:hypothetical protein n=1 Tax=uncultured Prochlorococcus sp. TaxID=159733 RepID=UPI00258FA388|nr:hypothetical protein [uncultured Prochlorococcus sp.]
MKLKFDSLIIAVSLILAGLIIGQVLLYRETTSALISHCRELNKQNISFFNLLGGSSLLPSGDIKSKTNQPSYCLTYISKDAQQFLNEIDSYNTDDFYEELNLASERIRIYSDNYQNLQKKRTETTKKLLIFIIILNILGLSVITMTLRFDKRL